MWTLSNKVKNFVLDKQRIMQYFCPNRFNNLVFQEIAPYMLFSGKQIDDMGFPKMCNDNSHSYTTVKIKARLGQGQLPRSQKFCYDFYYGLCFNEVCSIKDMNEGGSKLIHQKNLEFIIENIFKDVKELQSLQRIEFEEAQLQYEFSPAALVACLILALWLLMCMIGLFCKWIGQCRQKAQPRRQRIDEYLLAQEELGNVDNKTTTPNNNYDIESPKSQTSEQSSAGSSSSSRISAALNQASIVDTSPYEQPISNAFLKRISLGHRWNTLWTAQESNKIIQFSYFKIFSAPFLILGYVFYMFNQGALNVFSFNEEIYHRFYSNVAIFAIYIPDVFFFISGFLFSKKVFAEVGYASSRGVFLIRCVLEKLLRLGPIYFVCLFIYVLVMPASHSGPLWGVFTDQVNNCKTSSLWPYIFMIGNNFTGSDQCYEFAWFVQSQIQYTLTACFFFLLLFIHKSVGTISIHLALLVSYILMFVFDSKLPIQFKITVDHQTSNNFRQYYSHLPFYLTGTVLALWFRKQSVKKFIISFYFKNLIVFLVGSMLSLAIFGLVFLRPFDFDYYDLSAQYSLSRAGVLFSCIIWFLPGMVKKEKLTKTIVHNLASLTYPIILVSGMVISAGFWGVDTFPYVSSETLLYSFIPNVIISITVGLGLDLLFNFSRGKSQQNIGVASVLDESQKKQQHV